MGPFDLPSSELSCAFWNMKLRKAHLPLFGLFLQPSTCIFLSSVIPQGPSLFLVFGNIFRPLAIELTQLEQKCRVIQATLSSGLLQESVERNSLTEVSSLCPNSDFLSLWILSFISCSHFYSRVVSEGWSYPWYILISPSHSFTHPKRWPRT